MNLSTFVVVVAFAVVANLTPNFAAPQGTMSNITETDFFPYAHCLDYLTPDHFTKNGIVPEFYRWPKGVIPYAYEASAIESDRKIIQEGMNMIQNATCLSFVERTNEPSYVTIRTDDPRQGCFCDGVGLRGGPQVINLQRKGCMRAPSVAHELLHAAGLWHEHARDDRDQHIFVDFENILPSFKAQYSLCGKENDACSSYGIPYNVLSIMHYPGFGGKTVQVNVKKPVMTSLDPAHPIPDSLSGYTKLTAEDIAKVHKMYNNCQ